MKKKINLIGALAVGVFLLSSFFKIMHWMGAPSLLMLSTVLAVLYLFGLIFLRFRKADN